MILDQLTAKSPRPTHPDLHRSRNLFAPCSQDPGPKTLPGRMHSGLEITSPGRKPAFQPSAPEPICPLRPPKPLCPKDPGPRTLPGREINIPGRRSARPACQNTRLPTVPDPPGCGAGKPRLVPNCTTNTPGPDVNARFRSRA